MSDNPNRPPAGAIPLSDFFSLAMADPQLRAARQQAEERLNAVKAAISGSAYSPEIRAAEQALLRAERAIGDELLDRLRKGEWSAWGRAGSPVGPYQQLDAWEYLKIDRRRNVVSYSAPSRRIFFDNLPVAVPGATVRFFSVVVARQAEAPKSGAPGFAAADRALFPEIIEMMRIEPPLTDKAAVDRLVDADRVEGGGTSHSKSVRLLNRFRNRKPTP